MFSYAPTSPAIVQKYKVVNEDTNMVSEPSSPQSSTRSRSPSPDDILERVAADVKEYERENLNTFEASIKAKHNLIAQEKDGNVPVQNDHICWHTRPTEWTTLCAVCAGKVQFSCGCKKCAQELFMLSVSWHTHRSNIVLNTAQVMLPHRADLYQSVFSSISAGPVVR